jgi:hypothetical protein
MNEFGHGDNFIFQFQFSGLEDFHHFNGEFEDRDFLNPPDQQHSPSINHNEENTDWREPIPRDEEFGGQHKGIQPKHIPEQPFWGDIISNNNFRGQFI